MESAARINVKIKNMPLAFDKTILYWRLEMHFKLFTDPKKSAAWTKLKRHEVWNVYYSQCMTIIKNIVGAII